MKKILPCLYLYLPAAIALAHGEVDDGHVEGTVGRTPEERLYVGIAVGIILILCIAWFIWSKRKH